MKNANLASRWINRLFAVLFLLSTPLAGAYAACCAGHGGVASCNTATGFKMCKDGTASPTCKCKKEKAKPTKSKTTPATPATTTTTKPKSWWGGKSTTPTTPATPATTTTTKPKSTWWGGKSTTQPTKSTTTTTSAKGCCSRHGGVAQCDKAKGRLRCKDGTLSPKCACH